MKKEIKPIIWESEKLFLLDQRILPHEEINREINTIEECFDGIKDMIVRGAPCIGFTAIFGMVLWLKDEGSKFKTVQEAGEYLKKARPTAVNLEFEVDRCVELIDNSLKTKSRGDVYQEMIIHANNEMEKAFKENRAMAELACEDLLEIYGPSKLKVITHCNTGTLACGTLGTALGVINVLNEKNMIEKVWVDETRPYLQGSRLSSYELMCEEIPHDIVVEGAASFLMREGLVDAIFVGADRIAANGDTANKVGTSNLAIIADYYKIPFYVIAPTSSIDLNIESGKQIEVELRPEEEILYYKDQRIAPNGMTAFNPSFDITPGDLIKGIICEKGLFRGKDGLGALREMND